MAEDYQSTLFDSCLIAFVISKSLSAQSIVQVCMLEALDPATAAATTAFHYVGVTRFVM
jgi:hypothetical protein